MWYRSYSILVSEQQGNLVTLHLNVINEEVNHLFTALSTGKAVTVVICFQGAKMIVS